MSLGLAPLSARFWIANALAASLPIQQVHLETNQYAPIDPGKPVHVVCAKGLPRCALRRTPFGVQPVVYRIERGGTVLAQSSELPALKASLRALIQTRACPWPE